MDTETESQQCRRICGRRCTCPLDPSRGGPVAHFDDDVVQVVAASLRDVCVEHPRMRGDMRRAAARLLREGVARWVVPARQAERATAWRAACRRELRGYVEGAW